MKCKAAGRERHVECCFYREEMAQNISDESCTFKCRNSSAVLIYIAQTKFLAERFPAFPRTFLLI